MGKSKNLADLGSHDVIDTHSTGMTVTGTLTADSLGIGTSSPEEALHVQGSLKVDFGSGGGNPRVYLDHDSATDDGNYLQLNRGDDGLEVVGQDNVKLRTNGAERMRIDATTTHIQHTKAYGNQTALLRIQNQPTGTNYADGSFQNIVFGNETISNGYLGQIAVVQENASASTESSMRFSTNSGGGNSATVERMRIDSNGGLLSKGVVEYTGTGNNAFDTNGRNILLGGTNPLQIVGGDSLSGSWSGHPGIMTANPSEFRFHASAGDMDVWVDGYLRAEKGVKGAFTQADHYTEFSLTGNGAVSTWSPTGLPGNVYVSASIFLSSTDSDQSDHFNVHFGPSAFIAATYGDTFPGGADLPVTHGIATNMGDSQGVLAGYYGAWSHSIFKTNSSGSIVSCISGTNAGSGVAIRIQGYWMEHDS